MAQTNEPRALSAALSGPAFVTAGAGMAMHVANRHVERWAPETNASRVRSLRSLGFVDRLVAPWMETAQRSSSMRQYSNMIADGPRAQRGGDMSWVFPRPWYQDELDWMASARQAREQGVSSAMLTTRGTYVPATPQAVSPALHDLVAPSLSIATPIGSTGFGAAVSSGQAYSPLVPFAAVHAAELASRTIGASPVTKMAPALRSVLVTMLERSVRPMPEIGATTRLASTAPEMVTPPAPMAEPAPITSPASAVAERFATQHAQVNEVQRIARQVAEREIVARAAQRAAEQQSAAVAQQHRADEQRTTERAGEQRTTEQLIAQRVAERAAEQSRAEQSRSEQTRVDQARNDQARVDQTRNDQARNDQARVEQSQQRATEQVIQQRATERAIEQAAQQRAVAERSTQQQQLHERARAEAASHARSMGVDEPRVATTAPVSVTPSVPPEIVAALGALPAELSVAIGQRPERAMQAIHELGETLRAAELFARTAATGAALEPTRGPRLMMPAGLGDLVATLERAPMIAPSIGQAPMRTAVDPRSFAPTPRMIGAAGDVPVATVAARRDAIRMPMAAGDVASGTMTRAGAMPWLALEAVAATTPAALHHVAWSDRWLARFAGATPQSLDALSSATPRGTAALAQLARFDEFVAPIL